MKKEFNPYEQALALKELGFDEPCFAVYIDKTLIIEDDWLYSTNQDTFIESSNFTAPLYQQAFRFFRQKHNLYGFVTSATHPDRNLRFSFHIVDNWDVNEIFDTPEEAEIGCIKKLIELVKNKQNAQ